MTNHHYQPNILILGQSGTGKSSSLRNLPKDDPSICLIDLERKGLPFKGKFINSVYPENSRDAETALRNAHKDPNVKIIIFESFVKYCEMSVAYCRATYKNYDIWSGHSANIAAMLNLAKSPDKVVIMTGIDELVDVMSSTGGKSTVRRASVSAGREWEGKIEKEFLIVFFTDVRKDDKGIFRYKFLTNCDGVCSAKSPIDMFKEPFIDNDMNAILKQVQEYFK